MIRNLFFFLSIVIFAIRASPSPAEQASDRFPQTPSAFLVDPTNEILAVALAKDSEGLHQFEAAIAKRGFQNTAERRDYAVALLAMGRTAEAREQLSAIQTTTHDRTGEMGGN